VFTVPKMLRPYFMHHRELLGPLCTAAWDTTRELMTTAAGEEEGFRPGMVAVAARASTGSALAARLRERTPGFSRFSVCLRTPPSPPRTREGGPRWGGGCRVVVLCCRSDACPRPSLSVSTTRRTS